MDKDETLASAIIVLDEFYKDTAVMLKVLKDTLVSEHGYSEMFPGSNVCKDNSASLDSPLKWTTPFLSFWLQKEDNCVSIVITLKDYWNHLKPKNEFNIYGIKFFGLTKYSSSRLFLEKDVVDSPAPEFNRIKKDGFTEVERKDSFSSCRYIKAKLWDMKDRQAVADFAERVNEL